MKKLFVLIILTILSACSDENCISGNSNYIEKIINLTEFENVIISFPGKVVLKNGNSLAKLKIEENIENLLLAKIVDKTLIFYQDDDRCFETNGIQFEIFSSKYSELKNNGSADWISEHLECNPKIISNGSGDIILSGVSISQSVILSGSGDVDLSNMQTQSIYIRNNASGRILSKASNNAEVMINGSGNVEIDSLYGVLNIEINGSGDCIYSGEPLQINFRSNGSGKLIKR